MENHAASAIATRKLWRGESACGGADERFKVATEIGLLVMWMGMNGAEAVELQ